MCHDFYATLKTMSRKPFYATGIQFECQGSGKCCTSRGTYGYVYLDLRDQKRLARYFKLSLAEFRKKYCGKKDGHVHLLNPSDLIDSIPQMATHPEGDCIFLEDKKCGVYEARPEHCRTWPFWPENMTPKAWNKEVASFCPGIGKGKVYSEAEIKKIMAISTGGQ